MPAKLREKLVISKERLSLYAISWALIRGPDIPDSNCAGVSTGILGISTILIFASLAVNWTTASGVE